MTGIHSYSTTASENVQANTGVNWDEGMSPAAVNNSARQNMADIRGRWNDASWFQYGTGSKATVIPVYVSGTSFKVAGVDVTAYWHVGRRVKAVGAGTGTIYGTISASAFSTDTTLTVVWDSGSLSNETLAIYAGTMQMTGAPMPSTPSFSAYAASTQSGLSSGVATKVTLGTEVFDNCGCFASSRFTPTLAGYYQINGVIRATDSVAVTGFSVMLYKNGAAYRNGFSTGTISNSGSINGTVSDIIYCNGSTDYIELFGLITGTGPSFQFVDATNTSVLSGSYLHP